MAKSPAPVAVAQPTATSKQASGSLEDELAQLVTTDSTHSWRRLAAAKNIFSDSSASYQSVPAEIDQAFNLLAPASFAKPLSFEVHAPTTFFLMVEQGANAEAFTKQLTGSGDWEQMSGTVKTSDKKIMQVYQQHATSGAVVIPNQQGFHTTLSLLPMK